ncbi:MAG: hypothetical protein JEY99_09845 [Spirochaetales bacterium]|nr:hypothetical protein [Spirochaetales bacterium]
MKTITAIYTAQALVAPLKEQFSKIYPDHRIISVMDDSLIASVISAGRMTNEVLRKIYSICRDANDMGSDLVLQTCSSVGASADLIQPFFDIPILRIDRPMALASVETYSRIGVLATLPTTLGPTMDLVKQCSRESGKKVEIQDGLALGAFEALMSGDSELHDQKIMDTAMRLNDSCDVFLLAQGSMARMAGQLNKVLGKPVLTSPESGLAALKPYLEG